VAVTENLLITGPPRSGKTTVIQRVRERLESRGYQAGGVYCPELRADGDRVAFEIMDVMTGESQVLAHVDYDEGPQVGKYRVNVAHVDSVCATAFQRAFDDADLLIVDEIAPMEVFSDEFRRQVRRGLDGDLPLIAAIHYHATEGFIGEVKDRDDTETVEVTEDTRDALPATLIERLRAVL
jgi:nucleoside-triphosphatase